jgi:hypothetical protein
MYDQVVILPDGGIEFMRTVRLAALYADKVHVYAPTAKLTIEGLYDFQRHLKEADVLSGNWLGLEQSKDTTLNQNFKIRERVKRSRKLDELSGFLRTSVANQSELEILSREEVVESVIENALRPLLTMNKDKAIGAVQEFRDFLESVQLNSIDAPDSFLNGSSIQSSFCGLIVVLAEVLFALSEESNFISEGEANEILAHWEAISGTAVGIVFLACNYYANKQGCAGITWNGQAQKLFDDCGAALVGNDFVDSLVRKTEALKNRLGEAIIRDQVPDVSNLPVEEILEIRRKREPELSAFRNKLRELAANIDPDIADAKAAQAINAKIHTVVRPSLDDLKASVEQSRLEAYRRLLSPTDAINKAVVPFAISALSGLPLGSEISLSAAGLLAAKLYDFTVGQQIQNKKIMVASPWSILLDLKARTAKQG